jgi:hypothetical protein
VTEFTAADAAFASSVTELGFEDERPCFDPDCAGVGEPEQDGDHKYWTCTTCGNDFGFVKMPTAVLAEDQDGNCSIGVPEEIRRASSAPMQRAMAGEQSRQPVDLGISIGRRPGA